MTRYVIRSGDQFAAIRDGDRTWTTDIAMAQVWSDRRDASNELGLMLAEFEDRMEDENLPQIIALEVE